MNIKQMKLFVSFCILVVGIGGAFLLMKSFLAEPLQAALPECVDHGQTCIIGGTPCCKSTDSCSGKFPNTYCQ